MKKIEQLIKDIEIKPLSETLPSMLGIALDCKDFRGYCVLFLFICPVSANKQTNMAQTKQIIRNLLLNGAEKEKVQKIIKEGLEEYMEMKTISQDKVSSHGIKELEKWMGESSEILNKQVGNVPKGTYLDLSETEMKIRTMYESMRSYALSKLTYYRQFLKAEKSKSVIKEQTVKKDKNFNKEKVFIVHGHNGELRESVARLIEKQGIIPIILHEKANQGSTIIEKIERNSDVGGAICLFTADDIGRAKEDSSENKRARQNVVFEAGYFIGKLGRDKLVLIADQGIEIPSDLQGIVYTNSNDWRLNVLKEMKAIGYSIDYNKLDE